jgi:hypothetical protein
MCEYEVTTKENGMDAPFLITASNRDAAVKIVTAKMRKGDSIIEVMRVYKPTFMRKSKKVRK